jgi:hypothetical protein
MNTRGGGGLSRGIALLIHNFSARKGWMVSVTLRPVYLRKRDTVPIVQEAGWASGSVWMYAGNLVPHTGSNPGWHSPWWVATMTTISRLPINLVVTILYIQRAIQHAIYYGTGLTSLSCICSGSVCTAVMALRLCCSCTMRSSANVSIEMAHVAVLYSILTWRVSEKHGTKCCTFLHFFFASPYSVQFARETRCVCSLARV